MNEVSLDQLSADRLARFVGTNFLVRVNDSRTVSLELKAVTPPRSSGSGYESFSLIFDGPTTGQPLPQQIFPFEHESIGRFELFIVPVGNENGRLQYQAVFNRLRQ